jgi:hypothetical protein
VIYAVGYEREDTFEMLVDGRPVCPLSLSSYDKLSGEITSLYHKKIETKSLSIRNSHCFGLGIAFPTNHTDEEGHTEDWVGFHRNIEQMRRILSTFKKDKII